MLDFRKVILAVGVAALGLVGTASAQTVICNGSTGGASATALAPAQGFPGSVAIEGTTELLPGFIIACNGATVTAGSTYNILLTTNAPIANTTPTGLKTLDVQAADNLGSKVVVSLAAASTLQLTFTVPAGGGPLNQINVGGIRVNPSASPLLSTITVTESSTSIPVIGTVGTFAYVQNSLIPSFNLTGIVNQSACTVVVGPPPTVYTVANLLLSGGFPGAMKTAGEYTGTGQIGGAGFNYTFSQYAGAATPTFQGTTYAITFSNLNPAGVIYYVPASITNAGTTLTSVTSASATTNSTAGGNGVVVTPSATGTATVYYTVTADGGGAQSITIPLTETIASVAAVTSYNSSPVSASIALVSGSTYPGYSASATAYTVTQTTAKAPAGNGLLQPCATTILFPYVTSAGGFDTGIALTNASTGASTTANTVTASSGTCSLQFYGANLPTTNPIVTPTVSTGANAIQVVDVASVAAGFTGYIVATCNFQGGHGYAFLSNGFATNTGVAANYIGIVLGDQNLNGNANAVGIVAQ